MLFPNDTSRLVVILFRGHKIVEGVFDIVLVFEAFLSKIVVQMLEKVVIGGRQVW